MSSSRKYELREQVRSMFSHSYDSYMKYAFPHDELKPLSFSHTDSLCELGNSVRSFSHYHGIALTLIDSLTTLIIMNNRTEFSRAVSWLSTELTDFNIDVRVNLFELNIRVLGSLLSSHTFILYTPSILPPSHYPPYKNQLLNLAIDIGDRMLAAFSSSPTGLPYAWINLKDGVGVEENETFESCTAGIGTLILELGMLSYYTNNSLYYDSAEYAMIKLFNSKSSLHLIGNTINIQTGEWLNNNSGIGAGIDSFYEYLLKAYILFGNHKFLHMFQILYTAINKYCRYQSSTIYIECNMLSGMHTHIQFNSLSSFWPGLQVLAGKDFQDAAQLQQFIFNLFYTYSAIPERYLLNVNSVHSTEYYYPLRPELMESTYYLYHATHDTKYLLQGEFMIQKFEEKMKVEGGYASVRNVQTMELEDRMPSFWLAETLKYLYLLFDDPEFYTPTSPTSASSPQSLTSSSTASSSSSSSPPFIPSTPNLTSPNLSISSIDWSSGFDYLSNGEWLFTTEGHIFRIHSGLYEMFGDHSKYGYEHHLVHPNTLQSPKKTTTWRTVKSLASTANCSTVPSSILPTPSPVPSSAVSFEWDAAVAAYQALHSSSSLSSSASSASPMCMNHGTEMQAGDFQVQVSDGMFHILHKTTGEVLEIRNLGTRVVEVINRIESVIKSSSNGQSSSPATSSPSVSSSPTPTSSSASSSSSASMAAASFRHKTRVRVLSSYGIYSYAVQIHDSNVCDSIIESLGAFFGPATPPEIQQLELLGKSPGVGEITIQIGPNGEVGEIGQAGGVSVTDPALLKQQIQQLLRIKSQQKQVVKKKSEEQADEGSEDEDIDYQIGSASVRPVDRQPTPGTIESIDSSELESTESDNSEPDFSEFSSKPHESGSESALLPPMTVSNDNTQSILDWTNLLMRAALKGGSGSISELPDDVASATAHSFHHHLNTSGVLVLASPILSCPPASSDESSSSPSSSSSSSDPLASLSSSPYFNKFVLLQRGSCSFMDKILYLQSLGALGAIVINENDLRSEDNIFMMGVDGSNRKVEIPAVMISERNGRRLKQCFRTKEKLEKRKREKEPTSSSPSTDSSLSSASSAPQVSLPVRITRSRVGVPPPPIESDSASSSSSSQFFAASSDVEAELDAKAFTREKKEAGGGADGVVTGDLSKFRAKSMSGWVAEVEEKNKSYLLKLF